MKIFFKYIPLIIILSVFGCSGNKNENQTSEIIKPEILYSEAVIEFENNNYEAAIKKFEEIELKFPLAKEAIKSKIMLAFIDYLKLEYDLSILKLNNIIRRYPSYKDIDYVYYIKAMCYYEQLENPELDGKYNVLALRSFEELINYFPESKYSKDGHQKIILLKENIAAKNMKIGLFYLKQKKYLAALKRYQKVIDNHSQSKYTPEALHRLVEIYYLLGMEEEARKTASVLGYNYPESKWYEYSYKIVEKDNYNKNKKGFFKKIYNKIKSNNEE